MEGKSFNEEWEYIHSTQEWGKYPTEHVIRFMARNYYDKERSKIKVLDFGCGGGAHTWYLAREGFDVYAFDGSESAIKRAKKRMESDGLQAHFEVSDALELNYENNFFDVIIDNVAIYANVKDKIVTMYQKIFDILKPGGKLQTVCFGEKTSGYSSGDNIEANTYINIKEGALAHRGTAHIFKVEELAEMLYGVGFQDIKQDTILYSDNGNWVELYVAVAVKSVKDVL